MLGLGSFEKSLEGEQRQVIIQRSGTAHSNLILLLPDGCRNQGAGVQQVRRSALKDQLPLVGTAQQQSAKQ